MLDVKIIGYVMERIGQRAKVRIDKSKSTKPNLPKIWECRNACEATKGSQVVVDIQTLSPKKAKMTIYGIPALSLVAGLAFGNGFAIAFGWEKLWPIIIGGILWLLIGWNYSKDFRRDAARTGEQYVIVGAYYGDEEDDENKKKESLKDTETKKQGDE